MNIYNWERAAVVYDFLTDGGAKVKVSILSIHAMVQTDVCLFPTKEVCLNLSLLWLALQAGEVKRVLCSDWPIAGQICSVSKAGNGIRSLSVLMDLDFAPSILFTS